MALYESTFVTRQDISPSEVNKLVEQYSGIIAAEGGKVLRNEYWGLRNLAYRIKKNRKGHYAYLVIDAPSAAVQEMERNMRINEDVVRTLTVRVDAHDEGQSIMLQNKSESYGEGREPRFGERPEREPRGDRGDREYRGDREPREPKEPKE
ncbi:MAG: 30S ribosomal protein S6 [Alphaproteobacteria bacterium]|nr:30S ribosomal protein S6 [Alphaproteobacteria bacterium]